MTHPSTSEVSTPSLLADPSQTVHTCSAECYHAHQAPSPIITLEAAGAPLGLTARFVEEYLVSHADDGAPEVIEIKKHGTLRAARKAVDVADWYLFLLSLKRHDRSPTDIVVPVGQIPAGLQSPSQRKRNGGGR